jgi:hypothetical protein
MPVLQDPFSRKDIRVTDNFDFAISKNNDKCDFSLTGTNTVIDTVDQIIRLVLKTKKGSLQNDPFFGASPQEKKTYMTRKSINDLRSFILENIRSSNINPSQYPISVSIIPISMDSVSIQVSMFIAVNGEFLPVKVNSIFNESTQEVQTVRAFGV